MKVSIVTVCYNSEKTIGDTLRSIQTQTYSDIEYIVIDGLSKDTTNNIVKNFNDIVSVHISEKDSGLYDAMNKGISLASGDIIGILNSDDFYPHSGVIADVVAEFLKNKDVDLVLGDVDFVRAEDLTKPVRFYSSYDFSPWTMRFGFMPAHPGAFIKKTAYDKVGDYKLGYEICSDFDIFVRMLVVAKLPYVKLKKNLVRMRVGGVSTSGIKSYAITTNEILRSLKENQIYSNILMVLMRLPVKFFINLLNRFRS
ncbi:glycosyltransferase [Oceanospirillaceae bacterium]|nr:glycosyltransferase [Oceanospirillaceae bacterium]